MVDGQRTFEQTLSDFDQWLHSEGLVGAAPLPSWAFVTCGDWDFRSMLLRQCNHYELPVPEYCKRWINLKKSFFAATKLWPKGMMHMIEVLGISHQGRHHSGIDDARNLVEVIRVLLRDKGIVMKYTSVLPD